MLAFEQEAFKAGHKRVVGIDEAGRGPLAGNVVAAAVFFGKRALKEDWAGLTDSKKLTEKKREVFFERLRSNKHVVATVGEATPDEIDKINILRATHLAMHRAVEQQPRSFILVDGLPVKGLPYPSQAIVKGDALSLSIAAASIIAKVTRDRQMVALDAEHPEYGFVRNKGYGTPEHLAALHEHGPCPAHRNSFAPVKQQWLFLP